MIRLVIFFVLLVLGKSQNLLGVNYSFHTAFYKDFDRKTCDKESAWLLVGYEALNIDPLDSEKHTGIRAGRASCASSFPIIFIGGTLEFNVYVKAVTQEYKLIIDVLDEFDASIARYNYGRTSETYKPGWQKIYISIEKHAKGHINIRGRSLNKEIVLIDSFRYTPDDPLINYVETERNITYEAEDEAEMIFKYEDLNQNYFEEFYGSGSGEEPVEEPVDTNSFWTPVTIFLVTLAAVVLVAIVAVTGYHFGKVKAMEDTFFEESIEPPQTISIPRVTKTNHKFTRFH